jgi:serine/threonine-protein kinase RsbT
MSPTYRDTLAVLSRYLSRVNAELALERALRRLDLTAEGLTLNHLDSLLGQLERSLSLFVERGRLPQLMVDLGRLRLRPTVEAKIIVINTEADVSEARLQARQVCQEMGALTLTVQKVATLVSELARNIALYAQQGRIELVPQLEPSKKSVIVRASDSGPGIPNLQQILNGGYKSKTGLGMGIRGSKRLADRFEIDSGEWGTRVEAEVHF